MILNWKVTREEAEAITAIAHRASAMARDAGRVYPVLTADMDITATHNNGCPLNLSALLAAAAGDFAHDIFGIQRHIDRNTGKLGDCFLPRYAAK